MKTLLLSITTPLVALVRDSNIVSIRAEDSSGGFGVLPGHTDFVTAIPAGVMRWKRSGGAWTFCALRGGIFTVTGGAEVNVVCREAILGDDLRSLESRVSDLRRAQAETDRRLRSDAARLHARAIRRMMQALSPRGGTLGLDGDDL